MRGSGFDFSAAWSSFRCRFAIIADDVFGSLHAKCSGGCCPTRAQSNGCTSKEALGFVGEGTEQYLMGDQYPSCVHDQCEAKLNCSCKAFLTGAKRKL